MAKNRGFVPSTLFDDTETNPESLAPRQVDQFYFAAAGAEGDFVVLDLADTTNGLGLSAKKSAAADDHILGVLDSDVAAGSMGDVVTYGVKKDANVTTSVAAGAKLQTSSTAGRAEAAGAGEHYGAICLEAAASNVADVFVCGR